MFKRCFRCNISPLPQDLDHFWGVDKASDLCKACRLTLENLRVADIIKDIPPVNENTHPHILASTSHYTSSWKPAASVVVVRKLAELPLALIKEHLLSVALRDKLRFYNGNQEYYVSDGTRIWRWADWPRLSREPISFKELTAKYPDWAFWQPAGTEASQPSTVTV